MIQQLRNCRLVTPGEEVRPVTIEVGEGGIISAVSHPDEAGDAKASACFEADGLLALPGFIDIHTHGANGRDVSEGNLEALCVMAEAKIREGVTTFLPTTWTESPEALVAMAEAGAAYRAQGQPFARTPFMHIEGPYLNPKQAGAQDIQQMRKPDVEELMGLAEICPVGLVSLAVELEGALDFIRAMAEHGIATSAAHSAATYAEFAEARQAGLTHLTHYCNQMSPLHHRAVGLVGAGLLDDEVMIELICDRIHLAPEMIELVFKHRSCDRLMLITDSMAASWLGDGDYALSGHRTITVKDGVARIPEGNLAGSTAKFNECLKNVAEISGRPLPDLAKTCAANQARSLGLYDRGHLATGYLADVVLLDEHFEVKAVFVGGELKYQGSPAGVAG